MIIPTVLFMDDEVPCLIRRYPHIKKALDLLNSPLKKAKMLIYLSDILTYVVNEDRPLGRLGFYTECVNELMRLHNKLKSNYTVEYIKVG